MCMHLMRRGYPKGVWCTCIVYAELGIEIVIDESRVHVKSAVFFVAAHWDHHQQRTTQRPILALGLWNDEPFLERSDHAD
jgi:hypothetical protein